MFCVTIKPGPILAYFFSCCRPKRFCSGSSLPSWASALSSGGNWDLGDATKYIY